MSKWKTIATNIAGWATAGALLGLGAGTTMDKVSEPIKDPADAQTVNAGAATREDIARQFRDYKGNTATKAPEVSESRRFMGYDAPSTLATVLTLTALGAGYGLFRGFNNAAKKAIKDAATNPNNPALILQQADTIGQAATARAQGLKTAVNPSAVQINPEAAAEGMNNLGKLAQAQRIKKGIEPQ